MAAPANLLVPSPGMEAALDEIAVCATMPGRENAHSPAMPTAVPSGIRGKWKMLAAMAQPPAVGLPFLRAHQATPLTRPKAPSRAIMIGRTTQPQAVSASNLQFNEAIASSAKAASAPKIDRTNLASWTIHRSIGETGLQRHQVFH